MVLVTGATGFVGRRVVKALAEGGHSVRAMVHDPRHAAPLQPYNVQLVRGDVLDPASLADAFREADAVIHLVAIIREKGAMTFQRVNYQGTRNVVQAAATAGVKRLVHVSAIGASSDPANRYMYSRWLAEQEVVRGGIPYTILRFSVGFGEGDEFFNRLAAVVRMSPLVPVIGDGKARFQPMAVEDVARCILLALERQDTIGRAIDLGGPEYYTYEGLLDLVIETLGVKTVKFHMPLGLMRPVAVVMNALAPSPPISPEQLKLLTMDNVTSLDAVEREFGFRPMSPRGNIGYIARIGLGDAFKMNLGIMPAHVRDH